MSLRLEHNFFSLADKISYPGMDEIDGYKNCNGIQYEVVHFKCNVSHIALKWAQTFFLFSFLFQKKKVLQDKKKNICCKNMLNSQCFAHTSLEVWLPQTK